MQILGASPVGALVGPRRVPGEEEEDQDAGAQRARKHAARKRPRGGSTKYFVERSARRPHCHRHAASTRHYLLSTIPMLVLGKTTAAVGNLT